MRCFLSIDLPKEVQEELSRVQEKIQDVDVKMTLVNPEIVHLTMKFLGELNQTQVDEVVSALKELKFKKFTAKLDRVGVFPNPNFIKVVWIGISPRDRTTEIHNSINSALHEIRFSKDKVFGSHATIARVKWLKDKTSYFEKLQKIEVKPIEFAVNKIHLKKSTLTPEGPIYEDLFYLVLE